VITIAVDAMGGDMGPEVTIAGSALALKCHSNLRLIFYGVANKVEPILKQHPNLITCPFYATETATAMDEKPSQALRNGRGKSSMWHAIDAVKSGEADACVSAGNTGALMAMSYFCLRMLPEAERPGIAGIWPTIHGESIVLDIGATIGADANQLVLNIGVEEVKGLEEIRKAAHLLRTIPSEVLEYKGFVEGNDIGKGTVDVVVTEGFVGNIALKTAEGTVQQVSRILNKAMHQSIFSRLGYCLSSGAFRYFRQRLDPRKVNGGVLLGLNGVVVKSHGGTDAEGFASALHVGYEMIKNELLDKIAIDLRHFHEKKPIFTASKDGSG